MGCDGIKHLPYKATKPAIGGRYEAGQRRCQICAIFIWWDGIWCPCCGYRLRTKPRNSEDKKKLLVKLEVLQVIKQH